MFEAGPPPEQVREETPREKKERECRVGIVENRRAKNQETKRWNPHENLSATRDPYKTLFVCRLGKDTDAKRLKRVFEEYGPIKSLCLVHDTKSGKPRNYAFIEYENLKNFKGKDPDDSDIQ